MTPSVLTRRELLHGAAGIAAASLLPGCGSGYRSRTTTPVPVNPQPTPSGPITRATLNVSATSSGSIGRAFAGLSYEKGSLTEPLFSASNTDLIGLFDRLGPSLLRIGGNSVDRNVWNPNGHGHTPGQIAPSDVASLAAFAKAANWQVLYGINLGGAATRATTPALAAEEVNFAAQQLGPNLLGIEIGNEPDLYGNTGSYFAGNWSLAQFEGLWQQFRSAILANTPSVHMTGPASAGNVTRWTIPFGLQVTRTDITLLTQHYYRANGQLPTSTADFLISPDSNLVNELSQLDTGARQIGIPYRMAECNSFYNGGASGVSNSYASSLWVIDFLFNCAHGGASGVNFHGGGNGPGYTPIADSGGTVVGARPEYYGILLFTLAGTGSLLTAELSAGKLNASAYAVKSSSGDIKLVVVNKDSTQNLNLSITLPRSIRTASLLAMTGPSLTATSGVTIQNASVTAGGGFYPQAAYALTPSGTQLACYVPTLSAVLITTT